MKQSVRKTIDRCRAIHAVTTPGPYKAGHGSVTAPFETSKMNSSRSDDSSYGGALICETIGQKNARFFAYAHRVIPRLCNIIETQEVEIDYWKAIAASKFRAWVCPVCNETQPPAPYPIDKTMCYSCEQKEFDKHNQEARSNEQ